MTDSSRPPLPYDFLPEVPSFTVTSDDVADGEPMDDAHAADASYGGKGQNLSPHLRWEGFPPETRSFAVTVYDPDAPTGSGFWHWVLVDIPAGTNELPRGAAPGDQVGRPEATSHGRNDVGGLGVVGAVPPAGHGPHRYVIAVHALDTDKLGPEDGSPPAYVGFNLGGHTLARAVIVPTYEVPG